MKHVRPSLILACSLLAAQVAAASSPAVQIRDIDSGVSDRGFISAPFLEVAGGVVFTVSDSLSGHELWRTDGTEAGTSLIRDLCPGQCSSSNGPPIMWQDRLYFVAENYRHVGLWKTDGTEEGTELIEVLFPRFPFSTQPAASPRASLIDLGSSLLIALHRHLWSFDENRQITELPVLQEGLGFQRDRISALDGVAFYGDDGHLWRTEGTPESTRMVASNLSPRFLTPMSGLIFFAGGAEDRQLWQSDGTEAGTTPVAPGLMPRDPEILTAVGDRLFFVASGPGGQGLWRTDGTEGGTEWIVAVEEVTEAVSASGLLYFTHGTATYGREPWVSDGTAQGTRLVRDVEPGPASSDPSPLQPFGDGIMFAAAGQLWISDGTVDGTRSMPLGEFSTSRFPAMGVVNGVGYFAARSPDRGDSLWRTDGSEAGTQRVKDLDTPASSFPRSLTVLGSSVVFSAQDEPNGREPWHSDGTLEGTRILRDINQGSGWSNPREFTPFADKLLFTADLRIPDRHTLGLWSTGGTEAETVLLRMFDNLPTYVSGTLDNLVVVGDLLFFSAPDEEGDELWRSDGTEAGTFRVRDILPGILTVNGMDQPGSSSPRNLTAMGEMVYFTADGGEGVELWRSDGTEAGTRLVSDLRPGPEGSSPFDLTVLGDRLYFSATSGDGLRHVWSSDGTEAGTTQVNGVATEFPRQFTLSGGFLYFVVGAWEQSPELWRIDNSGTALLFSSIELDGPAVNLAQLKDVDGQLFFEAQHSATGSELWTSDGTTAGTRLVKDIEPGPESSLPTSFEAVGDLLLFAAATSSTGREMWVSDGTAAGTRPLPEIAPGVISSNPADFTSAGSRIFFSAGHPASSRELWAIERQAVLDAAGGSTSTALYLEGQRFEVIAEWNTGLEEGFGQPVAFTDDSGYFSFFGETNVELVVKVLDACEAFDRFWVFAAGLTDVEVTLTVRDRLTGEELQYVNPRGQAFLPIQDTDAFATCS